MGLNVLGRSRVAVPATLFIIALVAGVIGCGGSGSGTSTTTTGLTSTTSGSTASTASTAGSTSSTAGSTTSTSSTAGSTTSTATTSGSTATTSGTTTSTTGTVTGVLPPNTLIYNQSLGSSTQVDSVNPDGSGDTALATFPSNIGLIAPNPLVSNQYLFTYSASPGTATSTYDLYLENATGGQISVTGATQLTSNQYANIYSLQISSDGAHFIFVGVDSLGNSTLFGASILKTTSSGGAVTYSITGLHSIDSAQDAYLGSDGNTVCYTKLDSVSGLGQIWLVHLDGSGIRQITSDANDHFGPQLSKDLTHVVWVANSTANATAYEVYTANLAGVQPNQVTNSNGDTAISPCYSSDGTKIGFVKISQSNTASSGVYTVGINGLGTVAVVLNSAVSQGLFWTNSTGTAFGPFKGFSASLGGGSLHIQQLIKQGRWKWGH